MVVVRFHSLTFFRCIPVLHWCGGAVSSWVVLPLLPLFGWCCFSSFPPFEWWCFPFTFWSGVAFPPLTFLGVALVQYVLLNWIRSFIELHYVRKLYQVSSWRGRRRTAACEEKTSLNNLRTFPF